MEDYNDTMSEEQKKECLKISKLLKKYNINSIENIKGCTLTEFLAKQQPDKYDNSIYQNNAELKKIFAVINKKENVAIFINLNKERNSKLEYGDFAEQNLTTNKIKLAPKMEEKIKSEIYKMSHGVFSDEEQEGIFNKSFKGDLDSLEKTATIDFYLNHQAKDIIKSKLKDINERNGNSLDEKEQQEGITILNVKNDDNQKEDVPEDVKKACEKLGVNRIKGYFYVRANDMHSKIDNTLVNKDGDKVLMIEVPTEKIEGPNKYYGMQDEKMVLYGNEDEAVKDVTGNVTKMGMVVEPLKLQEPKAVEYSDGDGIAINEQIDDHKDLSVQEANEYREKMIELLEKYSQNLDLIKSDDTSSKEEKEEMIYTIKNSFSVESDELANKYDIKDEDTKNVVNDTFEQTEEEIQKEQDDEEKEIDDDEPDYFEVPGKLKH